MEEGRNWARGKAFDPNLLKHEVVLFIALCRYVCSQFIFSPDSPKPENTISVFNATNIFNVSHKYLHPNRLVLHRVATNSEIAESRFTKTGLALSCACCCSCCYRLSSCVVRCRAVVVCCCCRLMLSLHMALCMHYTTTETTSACRTTRVNLTARQFSLPQAHCINIFLFVDICSSRYSYSLFIFFFS